MRDNKLTFNSGGCLLTFELQHRMLFVEFEGYTEAADWMLKTKDIEGLIKLLEGIKDGS